MIFVSIFHMKAVRDKQRLLKRDRTWEKIPNRRHWLKLAEIVGVWG